MERSRNFYKTIRLGYILISVLIGCIAYNSFYEWQEIEALELDKKRALNVFSLFIPIKRKTLAFADEFKIW